MSDFIKGVGAQAGISAGGRVTELKPQRRDAAAEIPSKINLSIEPISPSEAEESAEEVRAFLEKDSGIALGFKAGFSQKL